MTGEKDVSARGKAGAVGRKSKASDPAPKETIRIWLDSDVIEHFRATGPDWQNRINDVLKTVKV